MLRSLDLFPTTARIESSSANRRLTIAGCDLRELAAQHGTPLYLYDQATLDSAVERYQSALAEHYPGPAGITYAGKAFLCIALAQWTQGHRLWVDCTGLGELEVVRAAGVPRKHILMHGVNKSPDDLAAGVNQAGTLVVDHLGEMERLIERGAPADRQMPDLWLRVRPGLAVDTHSYTQTGQQNSKFGMSPAEIVEAANRCRANGFNLNGLHFHLGSFFRDPQPIGVAVEATLDLMAKLKANERWYLSPGGGWGVAYHEDDLPHPDINTFVKFLAEKLVAGCLNRGLPLPSLQLEPGRSLVARAGVAVYRVGAVKKTEDRRWLLLDGGLADNLRPAMYGTRYAAIPVSDPDRPPTGPAWLAGPYCESGDVLIQALPMPDVPVGELIAVPMGGAYHLSMASNYNGARRPAVLWLNDGYAQIIRDRETPDDLIRRDRYLITRAIPKKPAQHQRDLSIKFAKYQALGNDYLVVQRTEAFPSLSAEQIRRICERNYGVGADGILLVDLNDPAVPFKLRIFNPDGSESETSGNGLRIFARYLYDRGLAGQGPFQITTPTGVREASVAEGGAIVTLAMGRVSFEGRQIPVAGVPGEVLNETMQVEGQEMVYAAATVGNPHCVLVQEQISKDIAVRLGPIIENKKIFPNRTNVQFLQVLDRENIRIEIWERGAGYTLASGSSSCAAAAVAHRLGLCSPDITVHMPGGALQVAIREDFSVSFSGPVSKVFDGEILINKPYGTD